MISIRKNLRLIGFDRGAPTLGVDPSGQGWDKGQADCYSRIAS